MPGKSRTQFSPLVRSSKARGSLFISQERPFYLPWKCSEGRAGLLKGLLMFCEARASLFLCVKGLTLPF